MEDSDSDADFLSVVAEDEDLFLSHDFNSHALPGEDVPRNPVLAQTAFHPFKAGNGDIRPSRGVRRDSEFETPLGACLKDLETLREMFQSQMLLTPNSAESSVSTQTDSYEAFGRPGERYARRKGLRNVRFEGLESDSADEIDGTRENGDGPGSATVNALVIIDRIVDALRQPEKLITPNKLYKSLSTYKFTQNNLSHWNLPFCTETIDEQPKEKEKDIDKTLRRRSMFKAKSFRHFGRRKSSCFETSRRTSLHLNKANNNRCKTPDLIRQSSMNWVKSNNQLHSTEHLGFNGRNIVRTRSLSERSNSLSRQSSFDFGDDEEESYTLEKGVAAYFNALSESSLRELSVTRSLKWDYVPSLILANAERRERSTDDASTNCASWSWNLDIFKLSEANNGRPLSQLMMHIVKRHDLLSQLEIPENIFKNFCSAVEMNYEYSLPYHNNLHAAEVLSNVYYLFFSMNLRLGISLHEVFCMLIAAAVHDIKHPGKTARYLIDKSDDLAILYNDRSILEQMHLSETFKILQDKNCDILANFNKQEYFAFRNLLINTVLATDLKGHFDCISKIKNRQENSVSDLARCTEHLKVRRYPLNCTDCQNGTFLLCEIGIKIADIAHSTKNFDQHLKWSKRIEEEFALQQEEDDEVSVPPVTALADSQLEFFKFIVAPFFKGIFPFMRFSDKFVEINNSMIRNRETWERIKELHSQAVED